MPFATRLGHTVPPALAPLAGLEVFRELDAARMAALQQKPVSDMLARFADGHRAYVARMHGDAAAWGWVATRSAEIGEVGARFTMAEGERYLWNFVTSPAHRGLGIYPRLLDAIVRAEAEEADRFWIAYAPENHASGAGIRKAGFVMVAELSFGLGGRAGIRGLVDGGGAVAARVLALPEVAEALAPCWRCAGGGRAHPDGAPQPRMTCAPGSCRCDYQRPRSGCAEDAPIGATP